MTDAKHVGEHQKSPGPRSAEPNAAAMSLQPGAIALIDALGFKGIWERENPADVLRALTEGRDWAELDTQVSNVFLTGGDDTVLHVRFFSDTIVVAGQLPTKELPTGPVTRAALIASVANAALRIISYAARRKPALAYRGCISFGEVLVEREFVLGPAVDEAAQWYESADAALVWLLPSAAKHVRAAHDYARTSFLFDADVPLKGGSRLRTSTINPLAFATVPGKSSMTTNWGTLDELRANLLAPMESQRPEVVAKRQETERFLSAAYAHMLQVWEHRDA